MFDGKNPGFLLDFPLNQSNETCMVQQFELRLVSGPIWRSWRCPFRPGWP
jgi:hypothetical protein